MTTDEVSICFDVNGNLYISDDTGIYQVNINCKNQPELEPGDYSIINSTNVSCGRIIDTSAFELNEKADEIEPEDEYFSDDCIEDDQLMISTTEQFLPEEKGYLFSINDNPLLNEQFCFSKVDTNDGIHINNRQYGDTLALYDTYVYNDDNHITVRSKLIGDVPLYVIRVYPDRLEFRHTYEPGMIRKYIYKKGDQLSLVLA